MNYQEYRHAFFVDPQPKPRFEFSGAFGITLFYQEYEEAVAYYTQVLGPPAYVEGASTRGWPIGDGWLTLHDVLGQGRRARQGGSRGKGRRGAIVPDAVVPGREACGREKNRNGCPARAAYRA